MAYSLERVKALKAQARGALRAGHYLDKHGILMRAESEETAREEAGKALQWLKKSDANFAKDEQGILYMESLVDAVVAETPIPHPLAEAVKEQELDSLGRLPG